MKDMSATRLRLFVACLATATTTTTVWRLLQLFGDYYNYYKCLATATKFCRLFSMVANADTILYAQLLIYNNRYQDDWIKTSASSLQLWEKAPFEPYALQKPVSLWKPSFYSSLYLFEYRLKLVVFSNIFLFYLMQITYSVVCPDIDPLTSAVSDFFQQLGTGEKKCLKNSTVICHFCIFSPS